MSCTESELAYMIARIAMHYPNRPVLAFDEAGHLVDWQEMGTGGRWEHHSHPADRRYEVVGGTNAASVQKVIDHVDRQSSQTKTQVTVPPGRSGHHDDSN